MDTLQCTMTLNEHTDVVTSLICWDEFLLSSSSDGTIKIWACMEVGTLSVVYTHNEQIVRYLIILLYFFVENKLIMVMKKLVNSINLFFIIQGIVSLFGMLDAEGKPILFSSCRDNSVRMYELPS